jgi:CRP-like cAMP-binding protein
VSLTQVNLPPGRLSRSNQTVLQGLLESVAGAPLPHWQSVADAIAVKTFAPGQTVFAQGVAHPYVYAVQTGLVKLCYLREDGHEWIKSFAQEGRFFASISALRNQGVTSFNVVAIEACALERVDYRLLANLATQNLAWANALHQMTMQFAARKEQREHDLLTLAPEQRWRAFMAAEPGLLQRVAQKDLALHLGMTPVGLNRIAMRVRRANPKA